MEVLAVQTVEAFDALMDTTRWFAEELLYRLQGEGEDPASPLYTAVWEMVSGANEHTEALEELVDAFRSTGMDDRDL